MAKSSPLLAAVPPRSDRAVGMLVAVVHVFVAGSNASERPKDLTKVDLLLAKDLTKVDLLLVGSATDDHDIAVAPHRG
jgi:hypothetical protein